MGKKKTNRKSLLLFLAVALCCVLLLDGPVRPMIAFATELEDEQPEDNFVEDDVNEPGTGQEEAVPDDNESVDEPQTPVPATNTVGSKYQSQIDDITNKQKELEAERTMLEKSIDSAKTAKEKEQANKSALDYQIYITQSEIDLLYERIDVLEQDIADKLADIEAKQKEHDENYAQYLKRLRSMQLNGEVSQLGAILGSDNFADYLATNVMMGQLAEYDQKLMDRVKAERKALEKEKADLENNKQLVEADREEAESKKSVLATQSQSAALKIQDMQQLEQEFLADLEANKKKSAEMQTELDNIYKQIAWDQNPYRGGEMMWPVPGHASITSTYGWRWGNSDFHTGMDISGSGVYGAPIVAAGTGRVAFVNTEYVVGRGYGIYVLVDHGGGVSTLYGHCSSVAVSTDQEVNVGDTIAYVGSTGWSTGPHLHFEVRINGSHTDPYPYLMG